MTKQEFSDFKQVRKSLDSSAMQFYSSRSPGNKSLKVQTCKSRNKKVMNISSDNFTKTDILKVQKEY